MNSVVVLITVVLFKCFYLHYCKEQNPYLEALQAHPWQSVQRYVEVRPGAFLFYWLYFADGTEKDAYKKPLIIWIQGGPGLAASGVANFAEIGPLTMDMKPRNHTWVKGRNLLLIDHPVSTGFSYAKNSSLLVSTDKEATKDLFRAVKAFFRRHKEFQKTPTYVIGQSYGGKLSTRLAVKLYTNIKKKRLSINFKGIGIGSGWVDPARSSMMQSDFLYNMGIIDINTYTKTIKITQGMISFLDKKEYATAEKLNDLYFNVINSDPGMRRHNYNNINQDNSYSNLARLAIKINKYVKPTLAEVNQSLQWDYISEMAFIKLNKSFLVPSVKFLETLLNYTDLKVAIYNGNLDAVTPIAGASNWVHALKWHGAEEFMNAIRIPIRGKNNGFYKFAKNLSFWSVFGSGHWVPEDNPVAMGQILEYLIDDIKEHTPFTLNTFLKNFKNATTNIIEIVEQ